MIYFAHPTVDYGTHLEYKALDEIQARFPNVPYSGIINPNHPRHAAAYREWGMGYFVGLSTACTICVFMRMPSGAIGAGVAKELEPFFERDLYVWELTRDLDLIYHHTMPGPVLTVDETRAEIDRCRSSGDA